MVAALDEVAWLLNIRGGDVMYNPVLMAYCIVTQDSTLLCANDAQLDAVRYGGGLLLLYSKVTVLQRTVAR